MVLYFGDRVLHVQNAFMESTYFAGSTRPCLRFDVGASGVSAEDLAAMIVNPIMIYDDEGNKMGEYTGYNTLAGLNLTVVQVQDAEILIAELRDKLTQKDVENQAQIATLNEQFRVQMADFQAQAQTTLAQALADADAKASANLLAAQNAFNQQLAEVSNRNDLIMEEVIATVRAQCGYVATVEAYNPNKPYISGDVVSEGYIAMKYTRNAPPADNVGTYWAHYISPEQVPQWDSIEDGTIITGGTLVYHDDKEWGSTCDHVKSAVFEPGGVNTKWEQI